jgi:hypothetical protein
VTVSGLDGRQVDGSIALSRGARLADSAISEVRMRGIELPAPLQLGAKRAHELRNALKSAGLGSGLHS